MNWAQNLLDDEAVFPNKIGSIMTYLPPATSFSFLFLGVAFPRNFRDTVKTIVRRLFRVYAHIYSNHFDHICALGIEGAFHISNGYDQPVPNIDCLPSTSQYQLSALLPIHQRGRLISYGSRTYS